MYIYIFLPRLSFTIQPASHPTCHPSNHPTCQPSNHPTCQLSNHPSNLALLACLLAAVLSHTIPLRAPDDLAFHRISFSCHPFLCTTDHQGSVGAAFIHHSVDVEGVHGQGGARRGDEKVSPNRRTCEIKMA
jgi:PT repeat